MEIRQGRLEELEEITDFCFEKNNQQAHRIAYCCRRRSAIREDYKFQMESEEHLVLVAREQEKLVGVLGLFANEEIKRLDCVGPFVEGNYLEIGRALMESAKERKPGYEFSFFFDSKNQDTLALVKDLGAKDQGNEQILYLKKENYKEVEPNPMIHPLPEEFYSKIKLLQEKIFPGIYLTGEELVEALKEDRSAFAILENNEISAYGVLKAPEGSVRRATAEIIAVEESHREKHYGRAIVNEVVRQGFERYEIDGIDLVVDNDNLIARKLYASVGFEVEDENCSYQWN